MKDSYQCLVVVTFVLRNAFSPGPGSDPQNRMVALGSASSAANVRLRQVAVMVNGLRAAAARSLRTSDLTDSQPSQKRAEESRSLDGPRSNTPASTNPVLPGDPVCARGRSG